MFTLDTNILIYYSAGDPEVVEFFEANKDEIFYLPSIVVAEFLSYPLMTPEAAKRFKNFARQVISVNLDFVIAEQAAELRRNHKLKLADAVVAASALITGSILATRNARDFKKIKGLNLMSL